jgi:putative tryptophan/tyrosine transport system substrate-binding protein
MRRFFVLWVWATLFILFAVAHAQGPNKVVRVAFIVGDIADRAAPTYSAFRARLKELGWIEGQNLLLDEHWAEGQFERMPELMAKALSQHPDVLVTVGTQGALAAKNATNTIPIVVAAMGDPVRSGIVSNYAHPEGNLTALSTGYTDGFAGKWLELILEMVPRAKTVAVIWNLGNPVVLGYQGDLEQAAAAHRVKLKFIDVREQSGLDNAFRQAKRTSRAAVVVCENLVINHRQQVVDLAAKYRLPAVYCLSLFARAGGLISYGTNLQAMFRRGAEYVDKILRGAKISELPVEQAMRFELVVNANTAKSLGLKIPESIMVRADEVLR